MGMQASADNNELVFRLRVAPHTGTPADLKAFADEVIKTQKRISDSTSTMRSKSTLLNFGIPDEKELAKAASAQLRHQQKMADSNRVALDKEQAAVKQAAAAKEATLKKLAVEKAKIDKKAADDAIREAKREAAEIEREQDRQHARHRDRQLNRARRNREAREGQAAYTEARAERIEAANAGGRSQSLNQTIGGVSNMIHGGGNLLRGVAYSGLVGEKDSQKMIDSLLKIEGTLGLIYGAMALGRGIGALGPLGAAGAAATAGVALAGATAFDIYSDPTFTGKSKNMGKGTQNFSWYNPALWAGYSSDWADTGSPDDPNKDYRGLKKSVKAANTQEKNIAMAAAARDERMRSDAADASEAFGANDRLLERGMRGKRTDSAKLGAIDSQLVAERKTELDLIEKVTEAEKRGGLEAKQALMAREEAERRIFNLTEQRREILLSAERQAKQLASDRAGSELQISQAALGAQGAAAKGAAGRYRSDLSKLGGMSPLEQMRAKAAFAAVRAGSANREQEQLAGGFNEFADLIEARNAQRGLAAGGSEFTTGRDEAKRASDEFQKRAAEVARAQLDVVVKHELQIKDVESDSDRAAQQQILDFMKQQFGLQNRQLADELDALRREMDNKERKREIVARR